MKAALEEQQRETLALDERVKAAQHAAAAATARHAITVYAPAYSPDYVRQGAAFAAGCSPQDVQVTQVQFPPTQGAGSYARVAHAGRARYKATYPTQQQQRNALEAGGRLHRTHHFQPIRVDYYCSPEQMVVRGQKKALKQQLQVQGRVVRWRWDQLLVETRAGAWVEAQQVHLTAAGGAHLRTRHRRHPHGTGIPPPRPPPGDPPPPPGAPGAAAPGAAAGEASGRSGEQRQQQQRQQQQQQQQQRQQAALLSPRRAADVPPEQAALAAARLRVAPVPAGATAAGVGGRQLAVAGRFGPGAGSSRARSSSCSRAKRLDLQQLQPLQALPPLPPRLTYPGPPSPPEKGGTPDAKKPRRTDAEDALLEALASVCQT
jgi:hypothetical protein